MRRLVLLAAVAIVAAGCAALPGAGELPVPRRVHLTLWKMPIGSDGDDFRVRLPGDRLKPPPLEDR
ncbi:MAG: hypothetical protein AB7O45_13230 [Alphaproteobacteria bacterium]